jgi:hypothetical protein
MKPTPAQIKKLEKLAKVLDGGDVELLTQLDELETKLDTEIEKVQSVVTDALAIAEQTKKLQGEKGEQGERGEKGDRGEPGKDGKNGRDGVDGAPGRDGVDGAPGVDGKDGRDGVDGHIKDLAPQEIRDSLELLQGEDRLDVDAVRGVEALAERVAKRVTKDAIDDIEKVTVVTGGGTQTGGASTWGDITGTLSDQTDLQTALNAKQATLVSATNIKTINGNSVLGSGDLTVGGSVSDTAYGPSWDGDTTTAPSKNAVYDKIETLSAGSGITALQAFSLISIRM